MGFRNNIAEDFVQPYIEGEQSPSFTELARNAVGYLLTNSLPNTVSKHIRASFIHNPKAVIGSLAAIGRVQLRRTENLGLSSNEVIARQEGLPGFTPHNQSFELNALQFSQSLKDSGLKIPPGILSEKERLIKTSKTKSRYLSAEPVVLKIIDTLAQKYAGLPEKTLKFSQKEGRVSVNLGKENRLSLDNAVRLVMPTTDGKHYEFVNLSISTLKKIASTIPTVGDMGSSIPKSVLISEMLHNGITSSERKYLERIGVPITTHPLNEWYDHPAGIVTISTGDFFVYDQRGAIQVNVNLEIDQKTATFQPTKIDTQAVHVAATAVPITSWFADEILPLGSTDEATISTSPTQIEQPMINKHVKPQRFNNPNLPEYAPQLAKYQEALVLTGYADEGTAKLAHITNLREVIYRHNLPDGLVELSKFNNQLLATLKVLSPNKFEYMSPMAFTTYFTLAAAVLDKRSSMLSVNPDSTNKSPNTLEMALLCNGVNPTTETILDIVSRYISKFRTDQSESSPSDILTLDNIQILNSLLTANNTYMAEVARAGQGRGTPGILARLAGSFRNSLEGLSRQLASPAMAQLEPNTQVSSLGNMSKKFFGKVKSWFFNSSHSRSVTEWDAINNEVFSVGEKAFANPLTLMRTLDRYCDPSLFDGLIKTYINHPDPDQNDRMLLEWMIGRRNQEILLHNNDTQQIFEQNFSKQLELDLKDIHKSPYIEQIKAELNLVFYLRSLSPNLAEFYNYSLLPKSKRHHLQDLFETVATTRNVSVETVKAEFEARISALPNGVHDLYTEKDVVWSDLLKNIQTITPQERDFIAKIARERSRDIQTSAIRYNDDLVFSNLESMYEAAANDAEIMFSLREISSRFSYALAEYLSRNPNNREQIANLIRAVNLNTGKKVSDTINTSSSLALAVNTYLLGQTVSAMYENNTHLFANKNIIELRNRDIISEEDLVRLLSHQIEKFNNQDTNLIKQLCHLAQSHDINQNVVINFLTKGNHNWRALATTLSENTHPSALANLEATIHEFVTALSDQPTL